MVVPVFLPPYGESIIKDWIDYISIYNDNIDGGWQSQHEKSIKNACQYEWRKVARYWYRLIGEMG